MKMVKVSENLWMNADLAQAVKLGQTEYGEKEIKIFMNGDQEQYWGFTYNTKTWSIIKESFGLQ